MIRKSMGSCIGGLSIATLFVMGALNTAMAADAWWTGNLKFVYPLGDGSFVLGFTSDVGTPCQNASTPIKYYTITPGQYGVTLDGAKAMLATALTAFAMDKQITAAFDPASANCYVNRFQVVQ